MSARAATSKQSERAAAPTQTLATDLHSRGIDLDTLQARIHAAAEHEINDELTEARLREMENLRATTAALLDAITAARNRALTQAVTARWTYKQINQATGLSTTRIGQITPARKQRP